MQAHAGANSILLCNSQTQCSIFGFMEKKLIVVAGPTAVGKTAVALALAKRLKTAILSADSRQFFKELNIGTAKPIPEELASVTHYFINTHSIQEEYDASQYGEDARRQIDKVLEVNDYVILCGGSGLYIKAVLEGFDDIPEIPPTVREDLQKQYDQHGIRWLQEKMQELDPDHYAALDRENPQRLMRALEVRIATGKSIASFHKKNKVQLPYTVVKVGLTMDRKELYRRIDERMDAMIGAGLFEEAKSVYAFRDRQALQTVGYQEVFGYLDGLYSYDEAVRLLKQNSRRYAKRQLTWFRRDPDIHWFQPDQLEEINKLVTGF